MLKSTLKIARCCFTLGDSGFLQFFRVVSSDDKANPVRGLKPVFFTIDLPDPEGQGEPPGLSTLMSRNVPQTQATRPTVTLVALDFFFKDLMSEFGNFPGF